MSVYLAEKGDLAGGTSSASTKLVHGGLRYLEHYEFRLVRESLIEREVLLNMAPHIISPQRFVLPHNSEQRPVWLIRLGLFLYDHLGGRKVLPSSTYINLRGDPAGGPLQEKYTQGFEYSDCRVDDARLVVLTALDAAERGAEVHVRTEVTSTVRRNAVWQIDTTDTVSGARQTIKARILVNAAGPWVANVISSRLETDSTPKIRLVKGSHVVVAKIFDHDRAYIFQNADKRVIFAIPYERDFTLIGTTDIDFAGDLDEVSASTEEIAYLCAAAGEYFKAPIETDDVVWSYSGVRPLFDEGGGTAQETTRDYVLDLQGLAGEPPLVNIFGGKITTYRCLAEEVLEKLKPYGVPTKKWTARSSLPGGDFAVDGLAALSIDLEAAFPFLDERLVQRLVQSYGTRARVILAGITGIDGLGRHFGAGLFEVEVEYLIAREWAISAEDILWRRGKLGLRLQPDEIEAFEHWMTDMHPPARASET